MAATIAHDPVFDRAANDSDAARRVMALAGDDDHASMASMARTLNEVFELRERVFDSVAVEVEPVVDRARTGLRRSPSPDAASVGMLRVAVYRFLVGDDVELAHGAHEQRHVRWIDGGLPLRSAT